MRAGKVVVQIAAANPNGVSFAIATASASSRKRSSPTTGTKTSSRAMAMSAWTSANTVGAKWKPLSVGSSRGPPP